MWKPYQALLKLESMCQTLIVTSPNHKMVYKMLYNKTVIDFSDVASVNNDFAVHTTSCIPAENSISASN